VKKNVFVIGGRGNNIPKWAWAAFEIEHVDREESTGKFAPKAQPDAIVVNVDFVSHQYSSQAHEWGSSLKIPVLHARSGWSSAVEEAAKLGIDWFVRSVQAAGKSMIEESQAVETMAESAWESAVAYERARADAAIKRLRKEATRREQLEHTLKRLRDGAEQRIVGEIRLRAAQMRDAQRERDQQLADLGRTTAKALEVAMTAHEMMTRAFQDVIRAAQGALDLPSGVDSEPCPAGESSRETA